MGGLQRYLGARTYTVLVPDRFGEEEEGGIAKESPRLLASEVDGMVV